MLREVVSVLAEDPAISWAGVFFLDDGELVRGPEAGVPERARRVVVPVSYDDVVVGELAADGAIVAGLLAQVAHRISAHVLLGWDTGGEAWEP